MKSDQNPNLGKAEELELSVAGSGQGQRVSLSVEHEIPAEPLPLLHFEMPMLPNVSELANQAFVIEGFNRELPYNVMPAPKAIYKKSDYPVCKSLLRYKDLSIKEVISEVRK